VSFWDRQSGVHWSCYVLLFTDFVKFGQSRLSGLNLGAFINSTSWIGSYVHAYTSRSSTCNPNRFTSLPVYCIPYRYTCFLFCFVEDSLAEVPVFATQASPELPDFMNGPEVRNMLGIIPPNVTWLTSKLTNNNVRKLAIRCVRFVCKVELIFYRALLRRARLCQQCVVRLWVWRSGTVITLVGIF